MDKYEFCLFLFIGAAIGFLFGCFCFSWDIKNSAKSGDIMRLDNRVFKITELKPVYSEVK